ncbi:hypothetical protein L1987_70152 [Smallanthus sonchifolius]|uniref:Uncharacterized protein n=1 Tax=Smallanthus sonchifolius TaxID=185202 RepID=A0ACB9AP53_9ASTR|nr:hypothetical protein L1987_70152 [Smallanthus sonchifolius]
MSLYFKPNHSTLQDYYSSLDGSGLLCVRNYHAGPSYSSRGYEHRPERDLLMQILIMILQSATDGYYIRMKKRKKMNMTSQSQKMMIVERISFFFVVIYCTSLSWSADNSAYQ